MPRLQLVGQSPRCFRNDPLTNLADARAHGGREAAELDAIAFANLEDGEAKRIDRHRSRPCCRIHANPGTQRRGVARVELHDVIFADARKQSCPLD